MRLVDRNFLRSDTNAQNEYAKCIKYDEISECADGKHMDSVVFACH